MCIWIIVIQSIFDLKNQQKSKMDYLNMESKTLDFQIQIKLFEQLQLFPVNP